MRQEESMAAVKLGDLLWKHSNAVKGILVLIVVMDHNEWLRSVAPDLFKPLTFHVLGFFLLAFAIPPKGLSLDFIRDRVIRYMVPFWWMLAIYAALFAVLVGRHEAGLERWVAWLMAALIGNAPYVKASAGTLILWFLPALLGLNLFIAGFDSVSSRVGKSLAVGVAAAFHLAVPLISMAWLMRVPLGVGIVLHVFILGLVWRAMLSWRMAGWVWLLLGLSFLLSYGILAARSQNIEIATLDLVSPLKPGLFLLQDVAGVAGVAMVVLLACWAGGLKWLNALGQQSLLVYLIHPLLYQAMYKVLPGDRAGSLGVLGVVCLGLVATAVAAAISYAVAVAVTRNRFSATWVTPRGWLEWPPARLLQRQAS